MANKLTKWLANPTSWMYIAYACWGFSVGWFYRAATGQGMGWGFLSITYFIMGVWFWKETKESDDE